MRLLAGLRPRTRELYRKALEVLHRSLASVGPISQLPDLDKAVAAYRCLPCVGSAEGDRVVAALEEVAPGRNQVGRPRVAMPVTQQAYWADVFGAAFHHSTERGSFLTSLTAISQYGGLIGKAVTRG